MDTTQRILWSVGLAAAVVVAVLLIVPRASELRAPQPTAALVAIEADGSGVAVAGPVEIAAGTPFTLHAVLVAETLEGETVYYTEAPALEVAGTRVPAEALLTWDRQQVVKVFWFTVEGFTPFVELEGGDQIERFHYTEFFRPEWPATWTAPGALDSRFTTGLESASAQGMTRDFGTQRFQVRIELFPDEKSQIARERFVSPGGDALPADAAAFPTIYAALPGAAPASLAFGLTQIEPPDGSGAELRGRLAELTRDHLAFARVSLVAEILRAAGREPAAVAWRDIDLAAGLAWGTGAGEVAQGDLLRVGARVVVLFRDRGEDGRLDRDDLCFDYERGAAIRPLSDVFAGEGLVEHAAVGARRGP